ncbi:AraC family transcriptional regulator [Niabella beijingensis]|uniref:AraC family transcriptional regulator n=1 Tax=Niabella beijingensis TaxID=2872700 RepID=UPI0023E3F5DA|nr:helix-turn-helix transcriptional regulator [Niabella beijingensis]MBZ4190545.1 helix-turn-helix transcriptional regulator [Niabella beijingensis]
MTKKSIPVYTIAAFNAKNKSFILEHLEGLLEKYPFFERPHKQHYYTILFLEAASGSAIVDNNTIHLDAPQVICIKPNSVFSLDINRKANGYMICFTEDFFSIRYNNNVLHEFSIMQRSNELFVRLSRQQKERWSIIFQFIKEETDKKHKGYDHVIRSYLNILLFDLDRNLYPVGDKGNVNHKKKKVIEFEKLVEDNFMKFKMPSWYASQLNITTNYLNKLCRCYRGVTSGDIIRKRIIIESERLLTYTALSIAEISNLIGFESTSYFVTFFKKHTGSTPEKFRKINE